MQATNLNLHKTPIRMAMKTYVIELTKPNLAIIHNWLRDTPEAKGQDDATFFPNILKIIKNLKPGFYELQEQEINYITHYARENYPELKDMYNGVGSVFTIETMYKLLKPLNTHIKFLKQFNLTENDIKCWQKMFTDGKRLMV